MTLQQALAQIPTSWTNARAAMTKIFRYWPEVAATWKPVTIKQWASGNNDDQMRDHLFGTVGPARIAATLGINENSARALIQGANEGGQIRKADAAIV